MVVALVLAVVFSSSLLLLHLVGGWVGGWVGRKVEENEAVGMRCWSLWVGGWVGG